MAKQLGARRLWMGLALAWWTFSCHGADKSGPPKESAAAGTADAASGGVAAGGAAAAPGVDGCLTPSDFVVPFQHYDRNDLIRNILVDGQDLVFRNYTEVFRVPMSGGTPASLNKMPGGIMDAPMWIDGDRVLSQSPGEPILIAMPKTGGTFTTLLDASAEKLGGGRPVVTRLLHDIGTGTHRARADEMILDGAHLYWIEQQGSSPKITGSKVRRIARTGGAAETLYEWPGELSDLGKAGDRLVFFQREPAKAPEKSKDSSKIAAALAEAAAADTPSNLMAMPESGGKPLVRMAGLKGSLLLTDGPTVYVSGYADGRLDKPGVFRLSANTTTDPEMVDWRHLSMASGYVYGDRVVLVGIGLRVPATPGAYPSSGHVVLTGPRSGGKLERTACLEDGYAAHAEAVSGKTLFLSVFRQQDRMAALATLPLP
jgi:hypothetical protein